jgi:hypothetical protein
LSWVFTWASAKWIFAVSLNKYYGKSPVHSKIMVSGSDTWTQLAGNPYPTITKDSNFQICGRNNLYQFKLWRQQSQPIKLISHHNSPTHFYNNCLQQSTVSTFNRIRYINTTHRHPQTDCLVNFILFSGYANPPNELTFSLAHIHFDDQLW